MASFSRPSVSNPYSESLFRTLKYRPNYPRCAFASLFEARQWIAGFVNWYNGSHRHSGIKFVTPNERHQGADKEILKRRDNVYHLAKQAHPERWSGKTRNWDWSQIEILNSSSHNVKHKQIRKAA